MNSLIKKFPIIISNSKQAIFFKISLTIFMLGFIMFSFTTLFSGTEIVKAQEPERVLSTSKSIMEVHIANSGLVYVQGAKVESISGTIIVVSTSWQLTKIQWTIKTNGSDYGKRHFGTSFLDSKGNYLLIKSLRVGDIISVTGIFDPTQSVPTIKAETIRTLY